MPTDTIDVAVALPMHQTYTYAVPPELTDMVAVGKRVLVPFGNRRVTGYILGPGQSPPPKGVKTIIDVMDQSPLFPVEMLSFFEWISHYYIYPIGAVIKSALPGGLNIYDVTYVSITRSGKDALEKKLLEKAETKMLQLVNQQPRTLKELRGSELGTFSNALIHSMTRRGWVEQKSRLRGGRTRIKTERHVTLVQPELIEVGRSGARRQILDLLISAGDISIKDIKKSVPSAPSQIKTMAATGGIRIYEKDVYRDPFGERVHPDTPPVLNAEQSAVIDQVSASLDNGFSAYLLAGVTGSGKTEVYLHLCRILLEQNKSVLILSPEIALISQMEHRFRARFGDRVAVLHSGLSSGERFDQWRRILDREIPIVMGARSAIFAPLTRLGMIVVDEEHDPSYKQEGALRYNARDLAIVRAKLEKCVALLGSATPSIQSYYNVITNKYSELSLNQRVEQRPLPQIEVVDLRQSRDMRGIQRFVTPELHSAMKDSLGNGEQVLLFLNRRGFATFPVCALCGHPIKCRNCDITMTLHQQAQVYQCHYCGFRRPLTTTCSQCGSNKIKHLGMGTEKLEAAVQQLFPEARIGRMDRDTTSRKGSIVKLLKELRHHHIDILVGTQMVAKGHDFPNITLVGIICADLSLSFPDFRAGERTFQLLAQVAGRAGRGTRAGRVILQTYAPENISISAAKQQDFRAFYRTEIEYRKSLNYPPFSRLVLLRISGKNAEKTESRATAIGSDSLRLKATHQSFQTSIEILGPIEASLPRIAKYYRWHILLKGQHAKILHHFTRSLVFGHSRYFNQRDVTVTVDVDPIFML